MRIRRYSSAVLLAAFAVAWACAGPEEAPAAAAPPPPGRPGPEVEAAPESPDARAPASETAFVLSERDLIPEGIACDPRTWTFYLGSFRKAKIVAVTLAGDARTFVPQGASGLQAVLGLRVDPARNRLWACTATAPHLAPGLAAPDPGVTGLMAWDLTSGANVFRWLRPKTEEQDAFNDLTLAADGTVYASGFSAGTVYRLAPEAKEPETWLRLEGNDAPNGIDLSADGRRLYVSTGRRVVVVDLATRAVQELAVPKREYTSGIDGLAVRGQTLLAIQRRKGMGNQGWRIARFRLAGDGLSATAVDALAENDPRWRQPTTGVVVGRWLYYVGTSQFPDFSSKFELPPVHALRDVRVMRLELARALRLPAAMSADGAPPAAAR
jgi:sugar lactone lactonase YvrE